MLILVQPKLKDQHSICITFNTPPGGYVRAPLNPINSSERFETICYDIAGP